MKKILLFQVFAMMMLSLPAQRSKVDWVVTTQTSPWKIQKGANISEATGKRDVEVHLW